MFFMSMRVRIGLGSLHKSNHPTASISLHIVRILFIKENYVFMIIYWKIMWLEIEWQWKVLLRLNWMTNKHLQHKIFGMIYKQNSLLKKKRWDHWSIIMKEKNTDFALMIMKIWERSLMINIKYNLDVKVRKTRSLNAASTFSNYSIQICTFQTNKIKMMNLRVLKSISSIKRKNIWEQMIQWCLEKWNLRGCGI